LNCSYEGKRWALSGVYRKEGLVLAWVGWNNVEGGMTFNLDVVLALSLVGGVGQEPQPRIGREVHGSKANELSPRSIAGHDPARGRQVGTHRALIWLAAYPEGSRGFRPPGPAIHKAFAGDGLRPQPRRHRTIRGSKNRAAFRRKRGFAYLWMPGHYLRRPPAKAVVSIALGRLDESTRFKEVVHPAPAHCMHHLEIHNLSDLDNEVAGWLREAADRAG